MALVSINPGDIVTGQPLKYSLYDGRGHLLLREGVVVRTERQRDALLMRGTYRHEKPEQSEDLDNALTPEAIVDNEYAYPFERLDGLFHRLARVFVSVAESGYPDRELLLKVVRDLRRVYKQSPDAMLGAVHICHEYDYTLCHPVHCALLVQMMGSVLEYDDQRQESLIAAALTQNIGMLELQQQLQSQETPLTEEQRQTVESHPQRAVEMLRAAGVEDDLWLDIVGQHHESYDGSGYPNGLRRDEILEEAQLLRLTDRYAAAISARAYRPGLEPRESLQIIYHAQDQLARADLVQRFIRELGIYPPGSFVKLVNGETSIVIRRGGPLRPTVSSYIGPRGAPMLRAFRRDTAQDQYRIVTTVRPDPTIQIDLTTTWAY